MNRIYAIVSSCRTTVVISKKGVSALVGITILDTQSGIYDFCEYTIYDYVIFHIFKIL